LRPACGPCYRNSMAPRSTCRHARRASQARVPVRRRSLAILLAALGLLLAQGPRLFHLLLVAHTTCEHGELVHSPDRAQAAPAEHDRQVEVSAGHGGSEGHDHCDPSALRHLPDRFELALVPPALLAEAMPPSLRAAVGARAVPLLFLAPKCSPPRG
jgi:hypothetical protein